MQILDMHCDTIEQLYHMENRTEEDSLLRNKKQLDLEKMEAGKYFLQNFAMFIDKEKVGNPFEEANAMIDLYYQELEKNQDHIGPVYVFDDIVDNQAKRRMSALLTIEGGEAIKGSLANLRQFYRLGVRLMTLTWNYENEIGVPNLMWDGKGTPDLQKRNPQGLTELGVEVVEEMERIGMLVDVSHLSDGGFWDVVKHTKKPFVASHSNSAAVCNVCRNLTDDMIRTLAERGGVMGLNFCAGFLNEELPPEKTAGESIMERYMRKESRLEDMVRHVRHTVDVGGIEVCALGSDFDGIPFCTDIPDASKMQNLTDALQKAGFTEREIEKICCRNALRVYQKIL